MQRLGDQYQAQENMHQVQSAGKGLPVNTRLVTADWLENKNQAKLHHGVFEAIFSFS